MLLFGWYFLAEYGFSFKSLFYCLIGIVLLIVGKIKIVIVKRK
jgi:glucose uptake protein GlcU